MKQFSSILHDPKLSQVIIMTLKIKTVCIKVQAKSLLRHRNPLPHPEQCFFLPSLYLSHIQLSCNTFHDGSGTDTRHMCSGRTLWKQFCIYCKERYSEEINLLHSNSSQLKLKPSYYKTNFWTKLSGVLSELYSDLTTTLIYCYYYCYQIIYVMWHNHN